MGVCVCAYVCVCVWVCVRVSASERREISNFGSRSYDREQVFSFKEMVLFILMISVQSRHLRCFDAKLLEVITVRTSFAKRALRSFRFKVM